MKICIAAGILVAVCLVVYWPAKKAEFVLDDYYTVVRNPLIKNPSLYKNIWTSRLFDAHQSSGYIKFGYYRPVLQLSWMLDYRLFGLKACGYQWVNLFIHWANCLLIYILLFELFGQSPIALKASLLFCVLPTQEWVVRYVTGRGDELSALFGLVSLLLLLWTFKTGFKRGYIYVFVFLTLAALTREAALFYVFYAFLLAQTYFKDKNINRFCRWWVLIGLLPLLFIWPIIGNLGNILVLHVLYFALVGFCLWMAQARLRWVVLLMVFFTAVSFYQGRFWTTEQTLLRHTRSLEFWPRTVFAQQLLMKYDDDILGIKDMITQARDPVIKAMWLRRLGVVYFNNGDLSRAQQYFTQALVFHPSDLDTFNAYAVLSFKEGQEAQGLRLLNRALAINPSYPDTLRNLGIYYYIHKDMPQARLFLSRCLFYDPENAQAKGLLGLTQK